MTLPPFVQRMNQRERVLSAIVAGVVFLLVNLFVWSGLLSATRSARAEVAKRELMRKEQTILLRESDLWGKREQWLREHQPLYRGAAEASALLDHVKEVAGKYNVSIENPAIGTGDATAAYQSAFASFETKSPWPPLVHFLYDVQNPEAFIVFENVSLAIDPGDATQMRGKFRLARWYAPPRGVITTQ